MLRAMLSLLCSARLQLRRDVADCLEGSMSGYFREVSVSIAVNTASLCVAQIPARNEPGSAELSQGCCRRRRRGCGGGRWNPCSSAGIEPGCAAANESLRGPSRARTPQDVWHPFPGTVGTRTRGHRHSFGGCLEIAAERLCSHQPTNCLIS